MGKKTLSEILESITTINEMAQISTSPEEFVKKIPQGKKVKATITTETQKNGKWGDEKTIQTRVMKEDDKNLFVYSKGSQRYGYRYTKNEKGEFTKYGGWSGKQRIKSIKFSDKTLTKKSVAEKYVNDLRKYKKAIETKLADGLNDFLREEAKSVTEDRIQKLLNLDCKTYYDCWKKSKEIGLPAIEGYKVSTLKTFKAPDYVIKELKEKIAKKEEYRKSWRSNYDCSVSLEKHKDGKYYGFFNAEYKGMGNGHYYYLLNHNSVLFAEDD